MNKHTTVIRLLIFCFSLLPMLTKAGNGVDNDFTTCNSNEIRLFLNGDSRSVVFGPGINNLDSQTGFYINTTQNVTYNAGIVNELRLTGAMSYIISAYCDRIASAKLYYRVYKQNTTPNDFIEVPLINLFDLDPATCYQEFVNNWYYKDGLDFDLVSGLPAGDYYFEFYIQAELLDLGDESDPCNIDAIAQCALPVEHKGRILSSRFKTSDPTACNYTDVLNDLADPTRIAFSLAGPLPVTLVNFQAKTVKQQVELSWSTSHESVFDRFLIERSNDAAEWTTIGYQEGKGNGDALLHYTWQDLSPLRGSNYYRLKMLDLDGTFEYSPIVSVTTGQQIAWNLFPNPAASEVTLSTPHSISENAAYSITNAAGALVAQGQVPATRRIDLEGLPEGIFFIQITEEHQKPVTLRVQHL